MPNDVGCPICGKRYFPHSLKIHLPQCQRKWASVEVPCPRCDKPVLQGDLEEHLEKCRAPRKAALHRRSWNGDTANAARALSLPISRAKPPRVRSSWSGPAQHDSPRQAAAAASCVRGRLEGANARLRAARAGLRRRGRRFSRRWRGAVGCDTIECVVAWQRVHGSI